VPVDPRPAASGDLPAGWRRVSSPYGDLCPQPALQDPHAHLTGVILDTDPPDSGPGVGRLALISSVNRRPTCMLSRAGEARSGNMIANLIPGLRDIRAGLAAGYVWLTAIWLLVYDNVPTSAEEATGVWQSIFQLEGAATALGIGVVLSFGAYLLGTASQAALDSLVRFGVRAFIGGRVVELGTSDEYFVFPRKYGVLGPSLSEKNWRSLDLIALEAITRVESTARANIHNVIKKPYVWPEEQEADAQGMSLEQLRTTTRRRDEEYFSLWFTNLIGGLSISDRGTVFYGGLVPGALVERVVDRLSWGASAALLRIARPDEVARSGVDLVVQLSIGLSLELNLVKNRLLSQDPEQFNFIDRIESESDLRFALIAPLAAITAILSITASVWWAIAGLGICVLLFQAINYDRRVQSSVVDRLLTGDVVAPTIERLERYAKEGRPERDADAKLRLDPAFTWRRRQDGLGGKLDPYYPRYPTDPYSGHVAK
jgi:hypothetical protein